MQTNKWDCATTDYGGLNSKKLFTGSVNTINPIRNRGVDHPLEVHPE